MCPKQTKSHGCSVHKRHSTHWKDSRYLPYFHQNDNHHKSQITELSSGFFIQLLVIQHLHLVFRSILKTILTRSFQEPARHSFLWLRRILQCRVQRRRQSSWETLTHYITRACVRMNSTPQWVLLSTLQHLLFPKVRTIGDIFFNRLTKNKLSLLLTSFFYIFAQNIIIMKHWKSQIQLDSTCE